MFDEIASHGAAGDTRAAHDEGRANAFIVEELLLPGRTDAVVAHENDDRLVENAFLFQPFQDLAQLLVAIADAVQVRRPVLQQHGIARVVRRKSDALRFGQRAEGRDATSRYQRPSSLRFLPPQSWIWAKNGWPGLRPAQSLLS